VEVKEVVVWRVGDSGSGWIRWVGLGLGVVVASAASGHPGGTPIGKPRAGIYCASCHASTAEADLEGQREKATAELPENKHYKAIRAGIGVYGKLSEADRARLVELLEAVDRSSTITVEAPAEVAAGSIFEVKIGLTGGAGPAVAVGLFDRPHRLFTRPISIVGFEVLGLPRVVGGKLRPSAAAAGTKTSAPAPTSVPYLVDIEGVSSSADDDRWAKMQVVFRLKAPAKAGDYPLVGAYLYGTEKAVNLSRRTDDSRFPPFPLGGETAASGRVKFSSKQVLRVKAAP